MIRERAQTPTARISVTVTEFNPIGGRQGSSHADIELTDTAHGAVSQARVNDPIDVDAEVYLDFFMAPSDGDRYTYTPVGIAFRETEWADSKEADRHSVHGNDPLGRAAFPVHVIASKGHGAQLSLFDANPARGRFKFDLVIQRSDGLLGVIDPEIRNSGVMK